MLLAIDAGNSTVGFGLFDGEKLVNEFKAGTHTGATSDEYRTFLLTQLAVSGLGGGQIEGVVISSVVPSLVRVLFETIKKIANVTPLLVSSRLKLGIKVAYKTPETLGADRIAAASAAYTAYGGPVVVADFGTASTFSVVDGSGSFIGGMIAPGLLTGYEALTNATSLPKIGLTFPKRAIGTNTAEGMQSGIIFGHAAMASGLIERIRAELDKKTVVALTGGLADFITPHIKGRVEVDPHLTLKGLAGIYYLNTEK